MTAIPPMDLLDTIEHLTDGLRLNAAEGSTTNISITIGGDLVVAYKKMAD